MNTIDRQKFIAKAVIRDAVRSFNFSDYGLDGVDATKDEEWLPDLADHIVESLVL